MAVRKRTAAIFGTIAVALGAFIVGASSLAHADVSPNSAIVGRWYSDSGIVVRFDTQDGYVESGTLGACRWPNGNRFFRNLNPLSGSNVFSAGALSEWTQDSHCQGIADVRFNYGKTITVNGNSLTIAGQGPGNGTYNRVIVDIAPTGYLDSCTGGWARDDDFAGAIDVHIYSDGVYYTSIPANIPSADVGAHRFTFTPPAGSHRIEAYALGRDSAGNGNGNNPRLTNTFTCTG